MKMYGCISLGHCMGVNGVACTSGGHSCYCVRLENAVTTCNVLGKLKWWTSSLQRQAQHIPFPTCCIVQSTWHETATSDLEHDCTRWDRAFYDVPATWWRVSVGVGMSVARLLSLVYIVSTWQGWFTGAQSYSYTIRPQSEPIELFYFQLSSNRNAYS